MSTALHLARIGAPDAVGGLPRLLAAGDHRDGRPAGLGDHLERFGPLRVGRDPDSRRWFLDEIERSGLRGRGGAGFPTSRKLRAVAARPGPRVVVANGVEGEPTSRKDRELMLRDPHLVIDGVLATAWAVGADEAIVAVPRGAREVRARMAEALGRRTREAAPVRLRLEAAPERFVMGEESALVHWLNGGPPAPTRTPPRPFERGVRGRPTLVQNVETLAHMALIARRGAEWFREVGTEAEPGSMLVTVGGGVARPGVQEIALGTPLGEIVARAGGLDGGLGGVLVGGYFGSWIPAAEPLELPMSAEGLRAAGGSPGAGAVIALPEGACALVETARVARYLAGESAGQCGPCVFGLRALADAAEALSGGHGARAALRDMAELPAEIEGRGACAHPDGAARLVRSALAAFPEEVDLHVRGRCSGSGNPPVLPIPARRDGEHRR